MWLISPLSQDPIVTSFYAANQMSSMNLAFGPHATGDPISRQAFEIISAPPSSPPPHGATIVDQPRYFHPTKAGRTRYGTASSAESGFVSFRLRKADDIGVPIEDALEGFTDTVLVGATDPVLINQGTNVKLHILVRLLVCYIEAC